ncbi:PIG-L deacetylase family protein [Sphingomonas japonica]|uniref:LmbE family N-acetylglucosaminyl deacetylase n=1 Tax=Sphingomonas japonica TaxID=511662 RepID=A0ABX0TXV9_9SPHN|nr:PIG-L family deacetylase [Sphingomonas japonica]NIJ23068.1 LmbE family N-acetylglucosaminyl deacetylase [Sphingomonas japonica]
MTRAIPLARSRHARAFWCVLAPHPDDETIGTGALIAQTAKAGRLGAVVYLTDGSGSHPTENTGARRALVQCRAREASLALRRLAGPRALRPVFLGWCDGNPFAVGSGEFRATARQLSSVLRRLQIDAIAIPAIDETHCDHVAAHRLARAALAIARRRIAPFAYRVWGGAMPRTMRPALVTRPMPVARRRHALQAHRSQTSAAMGPGFRVPPQLMRQRDRDRLYPVGRRNAR